MSPRDVFELLLLAAIWGSSFLFMRVAVPELGPAALVEVRLVVAAVFLTTWLALRGELSTLRGRMRDLAILGAVNSALPFCLFAFATLSLTAGLSSVLNATTPMFVVVFGFLWLRERIALAKLAGLAIGFFGVVVLVWPKLSLAADRTAVLAGLGAAACYGISTHFTKRRLAGLSPLAIASGSQIAASVLLMPVAIASWPVERPSVRALLFASILGVACTGIAYLLFFRLLRNAGPARASTVTYLIPVFGLTWGFLFLDERLPLQSLIGAAIVLAGTILVMRRQNAPSPTISEPTPCPNSPPRPAP